MGQTGCRSNGSSQTGLTHFAMSNSYTDHHESECGLSHYQKKLKSTKKIGFRLYFWINLL